MNEKENLSISLLNSICTFFNRNNINANISNGYLVLPNFNIYLKVEILDIKDMQGGLFITEKYVISSPNWDRDIIEICCSTGTNQADLLQRATNNLANGIFISIFKFIYNNKDYSACSIYGNKQHLWNFYVSYAHNTANLNSKIEDVNFYFNTVKDELLQYLGNQKISFVKLYMCNTGGGEIIGECRINDEVIIDISSTLQEFATKWNLNEYASFKQYIFISQDLSTYTPFPYNKEQMTNNVKLALKLFENNSYSQDDKYFNDLNNTLKDPVLAWEMYSFLPEIATMISFPSVYNQLNNSLVVYSINEQQIDTNYFQITSFIFIREGYLQAIQLNEYNDSKKIIENLIETSSSAKALSAALDSGSSVENIRACITFSPDNNYIFR